MRRLFVIGAFQIRVHSLIALGTGFSVAVLITLGFWQLDRAAQKRDMQRAMLARQLEPPQTLVDLPAPADPLNEERREQLENLSVSLSGNYWNEASFLVAFQFLQGAPGFELVTPFILSSGQYVLVSRGWISPGNDGNPALPVISGPQTLVGQLHIPPAATGVTQVEGEAWPVRFRRLDIARAAAIMDRPLLPYVVRLAEGQPGVMARHWAPLTVSTRSNIQYALQWFGMALAVIVVTLLMSSNIVALRRGRPTVRARAGVNPPHPG